MRRQTELGQKVALGVVALIILAACGTRHKTSSRVAKIQQKTLVGTGTPSSADTLSTLDRLSSFLPDSARGDSTKGRGRQLADSLKKTDSLAQPSTPDSLQLSSEEAARQERRRRQRESFDDIIAYKAQDSMVLIGQSLTYLFGPSTVDYKDKGMDANFMRLNLDSNLVYAHYILDSTGKATAYPKFRDGGESYEAKSLNYNFKTSKGFITGAVT